MDIVFFMLLVSYLPVTSVTAVDCGASKDLEFVTMPTENIMTLSSLDNDLEGRAMLGVYVALTKPFSWNASFFEKVTKIGGSSNYKRYVYIDNILESKCDIHDWSLKPVDHQSDRALFKYDYEGKEHVIGYFSKCPEIYHLEVICRSYNGEEETCTLNDTIIIGFFSHEGVNNLPLYDIIVELFESTGVKFGVQNFGWFSLSETMFC